MIQWKIIFKNNNDYDIIEDFYQDTNFEKQKEIYLYYLIHKNSLFCGWKVNGKICNASLAIKDVSKIRGRYEISKKINSNHLFSCRSERKAYDTKKELSKIIDKNSFIEIFNKKENKNISQKLKKSKIIENLDYEESSQSNNLDSRVHKQKIIKTKLTKAWLKKYIFKKEKIYNKAQYDIDFKNLFYIANSDSGINFNFKDYEVFPFFKWEWKGKPTIYPRYYSNDSKNVVDFCINMPIKKIWCKKDNAFIRVKGDFWIKIIIDNKIGQKLKKILENYKNVKTISILTYIEIEIPYSLTEKNSIEEITEKIEFNEISYFKEIGENAICIYLNDNKFKLMSEFLDE
ncbi:hypothetical protein [Mesoplasma coleopterae]|uniref:hypothetical protein n=1 Tax=Mesoplasma coleopterae TaxID=324078 RepID=UPI000D04748F|nr:hypothetical protein [Mesoplasma coleopterae]AVN63001.1 hypothetical protein CG000_01635 [Mesoplasma coleopterae]